MDVHDLAISGMVDRQDCGPEAAALTALLARSRDDGTDGIDAILASVRPTLLFDVARLNKTMHVLWDIRDDLQRHAPELLMALDTYRLRTTAMCRRSALLCVRFSHALREAGVPHVHFKGPLQQLTLYGSAFVRASADIDVLVRERDRVRAMEAAGAIGYRAEEARMAPWWIYHLGELHLRHPDGGPKIDLHHRLQQAGAPGLRNQDILVEKAAVVRMEGAELPVLLPTHRCLVIAMNLVKSLIARQPCGNHLADMGAALRALTPSEADALPDEADYHGLAASLAAACEMVDRLLGPRAPVARRTNKDPLHFIDTASLGAMVITPWNDRINWPRRRRILWALCGGAPARFAWEAGQVLSSELHRRLLESDRAVRSRGGG